MLDHPTILPDLFDESVPEGLVREWLIVLFRKYRQAHDICEDLFEEREAHDVLPQMRRALVEQDWRATARRFPSVQAAVKPNSTGSNFHSEMVSGRFIITESYVESATTVVREARFRIAYVPVWQTSFYFIPQTPPDPKGFMGAVLIHGPGLGSEHAPAFARVAFPNPEWTAYLDTIDLLKRYSDLVGELRSEHSAKIAVPAARLRGDVRRTRTSEEA